MLHPSMSQQWTQRCDLLPGLNHQAPSLSLGSQARDSSTLWDLWLLVGLHHSLHQTDETSSSNICIRLQGKSVVGAMHMLAFLFFSNSRVSVAPLRLLRRIILFQDLIFVGCTLISAIDMFCSSLELEITWLVWWEGTRVETDAMLFFSQINRLVLIAFKLASLVLLPSFNTPIRLLSVAKAQLKWLNFVSNSTIWGRLSKLKLFPLTLIAP